jgi:hypothetical protein
MPGGRGRLSLRNALLAASERFAAPGIIRDLVKLSLLLPLVIAFAWCSEGGAQIPAASRPTGYRTFIETHLLDRAPRIARVRFVKEEELAGLQAVAYEVKSVLRGPPQKRVLVGGDGGISEAARHADRLIFFEPLSSGILHRLIDVVELGGEHGEETESFVRRALALASESEPQARRAGLRRLVLDALVAKGEFARKLGAREFVRATAKFPGAFTATELPDLKAAVRRIPPEERPDFLAAVGELEANRLEGYRGTEAAIPAGRERELFLLALEALREAPTAAEREEVAVEIVRRFGDRARAFVLAAATDARDDVRATAFRHAGLLGYSDAAPLALRALEAKEPVRTAAVECLGRLAAPEAVPALAATLDLSAPAADAVLIALARINSPPAKRVLEAALVRAETDPAARTRRALLIELRDPSWSEKDAAAKTEALRRIRPPRDG